MKVEEKKNDGPPLSSQPYPWLVICPLRKKPQTFFSISEDRSYKRSIHEFCNAIIRASAQEWLVLEDFDSTDCYLWNPISNDKIQLPPFPNNDKLLCLLSAPPNDPRCRVLFLIHETTPDGDDDDNENTDDNTDNKNSNDDTDPDDDDTDTNDDDIDNEDSDDGANDDEYADDEDTNDDTDLDDDNTDSNDDDIDNDNPDDDVVANNDNDDENTPPSALYLCKPGYDQEFHKQDLKSIIGVDLFLGWTVFKGDFYVLTWQTPHILLRLDVDDSSGTISATPMTNQPPYDHFTELLDMPYSRSYLFQSSSHDDEKEVELLYVHILLYGRTHVDVYKITVFRFDFVKAVWEEVKSIGETAIFLDNSYGGTTCCTRGTHIKKESIYFTEGRYLYSFNLETLSISVSLPCPEISVKNPRSYWLKLMATLDESLTHNFK
ncbi:hypothetical protein H5410_000549 [Solanum commersonii]|uniref:KIB1-4 beta-propeller domain-containing protein n=1 Tax=Solanum commersonii TaxID=4109 RepID=A0A9J6AWH6_SOLCO|nr:hypothetical protein H5410_000549 [Solanum commersonii]